MTGDATAAWFAAHAGARTVTVTPLPPTLEPRDRRPSLPRRSTSSRCSPASTRWPPSARSPRRSSRSPTPTTPSAQGLSRILATDVALASRVMKLANSAYFGMRGRVTSLQFAVTVVGFTTVRTMATVALTDLDDESRLPEDFWDVSTSLALAAAALAPRFGERPQDALCIGLLAQMGTALLYHNDPEGYAELVAAEPAFVDRRAAEVAALRHPRAAADRRRAGGVGLPARDDRAAAPGRRPGRLRGRAAAGGLRARRAGSPPRTTSRCRSSGCPAAPCGRTTSSACWSRCAPTPTSSGRRCWAEPALSRRASRKPRGGVGVSPCRRSTA